MMGSIARERMRSLGYGKEAYERLADERISFFMKWANSVAEKSRPTTNACELLSEHLMECFRELADDP
ncbi:hypothetical protein AKJ44_02335 [candidate division MSBL1 archaeon SCGC-AAA261F17]|uniref:Uncharacterized protein n=1 Tax=candidate division MSBL1 archaeon SCGC-AAA261F17 TaxID=1698274 RepID=A0A133V590_9EURY|nr:hypothetical protein AKJ44_02335 [candidate division MSBL1 archaeon SCGC-AAA261F17]